ncbi:MAG: hypothetical protein ACR2HM_10950 [Acidimicrobiales bacterium]
MSTFWTPSGERPISRDEPAAGRPPSPAGPDAPGGEEMDEELRAELMAMQEQMLRTPAAIVVANHCIGLVELAALHLGQSPPNLADAQVSIDALAGMIDAVGPRLGENGPPLVQALNQMRMAFVEARTATARAGGEVPETQ